MQIFNVITAFIFGVLAAGYWSSLFLWRKLRRDPIVNINASYKTIVAISALIAFFPSVFIAFMLSFPIGELFIKPDPSVHLVTSLNLALCISIIGAAITYYIGILTLVIIHRVRKNA